MILTLLAALNQSPGRTVVQAKGAATVCSSSSFFGFPRWDEYLPSQQVNGLCSPSLGSLSDIWLIAAAIIEILLRLAAIIAVIFVIYGAIGLMTSQGEPEKTAKARTAIISALIGLAIAVTSAAVVAYIAGSIK